MGKMDQGFGAIGLLVVGTLLAGLLMVGIPIILAPDPVKLSDWLGFAGSVVGALVTLIAAGVAWRAVQHQIDAQQLIANRQLAIQSFDVLIKQSELLEEEIRFVNEALLMNGRFHAAFGFFIFNDGKLARATAQKALSMISPCLEAIKAERERLNETRIRRWIAPDLFSRRHELADAMDRLEATLPQLKFILESTLVASSESGAIAKEDLARIRAFNPFEALLTHREAYTEYSEAINNLRRQVHLQTTKAREEIGI